MNIGDCTLSSVKNSRVGGLESGNKKRHPKVPFSAFKFSKES
jgi:hypothetical protein